ncbi:ABC transporter ATP-binding protein [Schumannella sp. 10F1B-5-1]|uniref:ABC transporter ATP-binding protein n=1 Tax=Schumannella sp. 10F1B-5-1 TaxID=2590780 RepID=UPI0011329B18|nr:ABC transporter ATP-binding protein [Schumannella sp. 10F1B-5-1]TPW72339.1 ABC transporter ATP-binding protein [Schumannella sp. 10F1B-5-1]
MTTASTRLEARDVTLGYEQRVVAEGLTLAVPDGRVTVIVGPNACGKSTLLRALARLLAPSAGTVVLDGGDVRGYRTKEVARRLALLPQAVEVPDGISVLDLVARGRFAHQRMLRQWSRDDATAVRAAMAATGVDELADRGVGELSGGQRQRVLLAMVLAQQSGLLLLDEPTTFLDLAHQYEVLELCRRLNRERGDTIVAVLHDLNQAARYADHLVVMSAGRIVAEGPPAELLDAELVERVFGLPVQVIADPVTGSPLVIPLPGLDAGAGPGAGAAAHAGGAP